MNKTCYRIVFNKVRGLLMAVAETVTGQGKTKGETSANASAPTSPSRGPLIATVCTLTFSVWAMLGMVLSPRSLGGRSFPTDPAVAIGSKNSSGWW